MSINPALTDLEPLVGRWRMWRDTPAFSQRFRAQVDPDAKAIRGRWEKSADQGATWEHDFNIDYIREQGQGPTV